MLKKIGFKVAVVVLGLLVVVACSNQSNYALWTSAGQLIDIWINAYDPGFDKTQLDSSWAAAGQDILNWKSGTECQNISAAINDALGIVATIPVNNAREAAILATAVVGAEVVEAFFLHCSPSSAALAMKTIQYPPLLQTAVEIQRVHPATDSKQLNKQWKAAGGPSK